MAGNVTIIKRKRKTAGGGHHGGAWKVAYADFVTAMMAFFLLMWLLSAASEDVRKGLADYFDDRIPISRISGGGQGALRGDSVTATDRLAETAAARVPTNAQAPADDAAPGASKDPAAAAEEARAFERIEAMFASLSGESDAEDPLLRHIQTRLTPDGLVIDIFDGADGALFASGDARPTPLLEALMEVVASVAELVTNDVAIAGHTDAAPFRVGDDDGNWRLSSDRADAARRLLARSGLPLDRVAKVTGRAATAPMSADPQDPRNRRIEITLLRDHPIR